MTSTKYSIPARKVRTQSRQERYVLNPGKKGTYYVFNPGKKGTWSILARKVRTQSRQERFVFNPGKKGTYLIPARKVRILKNLFKARRYILDREVITVLTRDLHGELIQK